MWYYSRVVFFMFIFMTTSRFSRLARVVGVGVISLMTFVALASAQSDTQATTLPTPASGSGYYSQGAVAGTAVDGYGRGDRDSDNDWKCNINGKQVPCDQITKGLGSLLGIFGSIFIVLFIIALLATIFWIYMLVDCLKRKFKNDTDKVLWAVVIFFLHFVGAVVYYFAVKRENHK